MNLYVVKYKGSYANEKSCAIVASTALAAIQGAKAVMKKRYDSSSEITTVTKMQVVDTVVK